MTSLPFPIVFEDEFFLVLNKPAGMTVNNSDTTAGIQTVQDFMQEYLGIKLPQGFVKSEEYSDEQAFYERAGIAHRLDKETSGILLVAKTVESFSALLTQFRERTIKKSYIALAHGKVMQDEGEISAPVGRLPWNRRQFGVVAGGREAKTLYKVKNYYKSPVAKQKEILTLLELFPVTGRTHQIRVHLKYINHPIFSDFLYAGRKVQRDDRNILERVFLHAYSIQLYHPITKEEMYFIAELPHELQSVLDISEKVEIE